jgi:lipooligosaccharide transport system ATP-binding protein
VTDRTNAAAIVARGLTKQFGAFTAVDGIDFHVARGECLGLLGPNGAGKSTTIRMLIGHAVRTGGTLTVLGLDPATHAREVRARVGIVPQDDNLDPDLTVRENLVVYARYFGIGGADAADRADKALAFVALNEKATVKVPKLSGGMKRRLVLARALIHRPELVILDEPTTGLDPAARQLVWQKLRELKEQGVTLLLTTHYMDEAEVLCDRIVIMHTGHILDEDTPQGLIRRHVGASVEGPHGPRRATLEDVFLKLTGRELNE